MTGKQQLNTISKNLKKPLEGQIPPGATTFMDASVLQYQINYKHPALAAKIFRLQPGAHNLRTIVSTYASCLMELAGPYANSYWFFEGDADKPASPSRERMRAKRLNKALRTIISHNADKALASALGRPPPWFIERVANDMRGRGLTV